MAVSNLKVVEKPRVSIDTDEANRIYIELQAADAIVDLVRHHAQAERYVQQIDWFIKAHPELRDEICAPGRVSADQIVHALYSVTTKIVRAKDVLRRALVPGERE
jgi:hypothetical protein